jgi:hypothetical protein
VIYSFVYVAEQFLTQNAGSDNIIQTIITQGSVFAGAGSYPLEGGYL